jgi:hypothetical protein
MNVYKFECANIKSVKEATNRLVAGEVFYINTQSLGPNIVKIYFDSTKVDDPFRAIYQSSELIQEQSLGLHSGSLWSFIADWLVKVEMDWWENIQDPGVLCWVSETCIHKPNPEDCFIRLIESYNSSTKFYISYDWGSKWNYAVPMTEEEVKKYILKREG